MNDREFDERFVSEHADPLAHTHYDFPFHEVCERVDGEIATPERHSVEQAVDIARDTLLWIGEAVRTRRAGARTRLAGLRALACIHVLWPSLLPVGTMRELAEALGITYKRLSEVTSEASKIMHTKNASQSASFGYGHLTRATSNHPPRPAHVVECFVRGEPRPQPRARATFRGRRPVWYNPATADAWKKAVFYTVRQTSLPPESVRQNSAVQIEAVFRFERPRGHFNAAGHLKPDAPERHAQRPDLDNLLKAVMDALTDAGAWHDDAQVWSVTSSREWSEGAESAGCRLRIVWHAIPGTVL